MFAQIKCNELGIGIWGTEEEEQGKEESMGKFGYEKKNSELLPNNFRVFVIEKVSREL